MFTMLGPQKVQHDSGYVVQTGDRYHLEYLEGERVAVVEVDFGSVISIYVDRIAWKTPSNALPITWQEKAKIVERVVAVLRFQHERFELVPG